MIFSIILTLVTIVLWISIPEELFLNTISLILSSVLIVTTILLNKSKLEHLYKSRWFNKFSVKALSVFLVISILSLVNYLGVKRGFQFDLTRSGRNSLTDKSLKVVRALNGKVDVKVFARKNNFLFIEKVLSLYSAHKYDLEIDFVDVEIRPDLVKKHNVEKVPTLLFRYKNKEEKLHSINELSVTNAFIRLLRNPPLVAYSIGHGEPNLYDTTKQGYSYLRELMEKSTYVVKEIDLRTGAKISKETKVLIIWGAKRPFMDHEIDSIKKFLERGGDLFVSMNFYVGKNYHKNLIDLLYEYGGQVTNNLVIDLKNFVNGSRGSVPIVKNLNPDHVITKELSDHLFLPLPVEILNTPNKKIKGSILLQSSIFPNSYSKNEKIKQISQEELSFKDGDKKGPISLASSFEDSENGRRMVLMGAPSFVQNSYASYGGQFKFFLNSLSWLIGEDQLTSFNMPIIKERPIFISRSQLGVIFYFSVLCAPLILLSVAFGIYFYKKRL